MPVDVDDRMGEALADLGGALHGDLLRLRRSRTPPSSSGSDRRRRLVSAKTAFAIAGATSGVPTSPMPPGASPLSIRVTWIGGTS